MSDLEKINIRVPEKTGKIILDDADSFEVLKKDGETINTNDFLSKLILGYYDSYRNECQQAYDNIIDELKDIGIKNENRSVIADRILKNVVLPKVPPRKGKKPHSFSLKPTNKTEGLITSISNDPEIADSIPQYLCQMLVSYSEKPFSERERIIFHDNYEFLKQACQDSKPVTFSTIRQPNEIHKVVPYQLATWEERYNYLLCAETDKTGIQKAMSYRLNRLRNVGYSRNITENHISDTVQGYLERMLKYGPAFSINDDEESCVRLTEAGKKAFRQIYFGRPQEDRVDPKPDGYYYYFKGSQDQIFFYFRRFDNDAEVIAPESLRQKMLEFHKNAYEVYK